MNQDDYCCLDGCCGPGSWCCGHARPHTHDDEPDDREALAEHVAAHACAERHNGLRVGTAMDRLRVAFKDGAAWQRWRHPEPVKPSREDVARLIDPAAWGCHDTCNVCKTSRSSSLRLADAVLALFEGGES